MREILFRGKRIDSGEWVYGTMYKIAIDLNPFILTGGKLGCSYQVDEETVGQYTGLKDKNGKRIFEGDIVRLPELYGNGKAVIRFCGTAFKACGELFSYQVSESMEVIGNVHDNPELLGK